MRENASMVYLLVSEVMLRPRKGQFEGQVQLVQESARGCLSGSHSCVLLPFQPARVLRMDGAAARRLEEQSKFKTVS